MSFFVTLYEEIRFHVTLLNCNCLGCSATHNNQFLISVNSKLRKSIRIETSASNDIK
jgi:hypothetical protein